MSVTAAHMDQSVPTIGQLMANARALVPHLKAEAAATEDRRTLSKEMVRKVFDAGLFRYFQPRRYGGYEMDWGTQYHLSKIVAHGCPSTAWVVSVVGQHCCHAARFGKEAQDEVWGDSQDVIVATTSMQKPGATIVRESGGYRINGCFGFSSAIDHSSWGMANGVAEGEDERRYFLLPRGDYTIDDNWHVAGMRGTGTKDLNAQNAFVPEYRSIKFSTWVGSNPPGGDVNPSYIYSMEMEPVLASSPLGPVVGTAEAALEDYLEITRERRSANFGGKVGDNPAVQMRISESAAEVHAADVVACADFDLLNERAKAGQPLTEEERVSVARNRAFIAQLCLRSTDRLVGMMGAIGLFDSNPVQRQFRDLRAMATQLGVAYDVNMPHYGRWALGLDAKNRIGAHETKTAIDRTSVEPTMNRSE